MRTSINTSAVPAATRTGVTTFPLASIRVASGGTATSARTAAMRPSRISSVPLAISPAGPLVLLRPQVHASVDVAAGRGGGRESRNQQRRPTGATNRQDTDYR